jgi:hypothetical protein
MHTRAGLLERTRELGALVRRPSNRDPDSSQRFHSL